MAHAAAPLLNYLCGQSGKPVGQQAFSDPLKLASLLRRIAHRVSLEPDKIPAPWNTLSSQGM